MAGISIINVSRFNSIKVLKKANYTILKRYSIAGIRKEFVKEGKIV